MRAGRVFLDTPAERWTSRTEGRVSEDREGGATLLRDLSVLMEGEVARRAARECLEGGTVGGGLLELGNPSVNGGGERRLYL